MNKLEDYEHKKVGRGYKVKIECLNCGEEQWKPWNVVKDGRGKYCDKDCYNEDRHGDDRLENYETRRSESRHIEVKVNCEYCGEEAWVKWARRKKGMGKFCSRKCFQDNEKKEGKKTWGKENANFYWDENRETWYAYWKDLEGIQRSTTKARWLWETNKGEVPDGYWVTYKDGNRKNCELDNLKVVPRGEIMSEAMMGHEVSEETKEKLSEAHKGKTLSEEHKENIKKSMESRWADPSSVFNTSEYRNKLFGHVPWNKGIKMPEETKQKMSESQILRFLDEEKRNKISKSLLEYWENNQEARKNHSKIMRKVFEDNPEIKEKISMALEGREITEDHRENLSKALTGNEKISGENSNFWRGGVSDDPYPPEFNKTLKRKIKKRDDYICQICDENVKGKKAHIHHIDGDKQNYKEWNLVLLCVNCHNAVHERINKTNDKIEYFKSMLYK